MGSPQGPSPSEMWEPHHESLLSASNIRSSSNGAKKVSRSANHLLNFSYPARERPVASTYNRPKLVHAPYRRERFVQAKYVTFNDMHHFTTDLQELTDTDRFQLPLHRFKGRRVLRQFDRP